LVDAALGAVAFVLASWVWTQLALRALALSPGMPSWRFALAALSRLLALTPLEEPEPPSPAAAEPPPQQPATKLKAATSVDAVGAAMSGKVEAQHASDRPAPWEVPHASTAPGAPGFPWAAALDAVGTSVAAGVRNAQRRVLQELKAQPWAAGLLGSEDSCKRVVPDAAHKSGLFDCVQTSSNEHHGDVGSTPYEAGLSARAQRDDVQEMFVVQPAISTPTSPLPTPSVTATPSSIKESTIDASLLGEAATATTLDDGELSTGTAPAEDAAIAPVLDDSDASGPALGPGPGNAASGDAVTAMDDGEISVGKSHEEEGLPVWPDTCEGSDSNESAPVLRWERREKSLSTRKQPEKEERCLDERRRRAASETRQLAPGLLVLPPGSERPGDGAQEEPLEEHPCARGLSAATASSTEVRPEGVSRGSRSISSTRDPSIASRVMPSALETEVKSVSVQRSTEAGESCNQSVASAAVTGSPTVAEGSRVLAKAASATSAASAPSTCECQESPAAASEPEATPSAGTSAAQVQTAPLSQASAPARPLPLAVAATQQSTTTDTSMSQAAAPTQRRVVVLQRGQCINPAAFSTAPGAAGAEPASSSTARSQARQPSANALLSADPAASSASRSHIEQAKSLKSNKMTAARPPPAAPAWRPSLRTAVSSRNTGARGDVATAAAGASAAPGSATSAQPPPPPATPSKRSFYSLSVKEQPSSSAHTS